MMAAARRHRPLVPFTARVRWDPAMGWPFPNEFPAVPGVRAAVKRHAVALVRERAAKRGAR